LGDTWKKHFPFIAALFFFILFNNIVGIIPGCHPGTGTIGVTAALALCSFVYFIAVGIKRMGVLGYIKSFAPKGLALPMAIMVWVIELFSTFLRLITLAVRLFCNMFAGHVVMGTFAILASLFFEPLLPGLLGSGARQRRGAQSSGCSFSSSSIWSRFWSQ
jgi:F-type H+-transporting ATPase subunit a